MNGNHLYLFFSFIWSCFHFIELRPTATNNSVITTCKHSGTLALTFDDGPYKYETELSNYLHERQIKGSFFVNGNNYLCIYDESVVEMLRYTFSQGHLIGSHTWSHPNISTLSDDEFRQQLQLTETALMKILGVKPKYFRPPYGSYNQKSLDILHERGYTVVNWSFDSKDSVGASAKESKDLYSELAKQFPTPQITLNHETIQTTPEQVIPYAIPILQKAGYRLVDVSECLGVSTKNEDFYQWVGIPSDRDASWTCEGTPAPHS